MWQLYFSTQVRVNLKIDYTPIVDGKQLNQKAAEKEKKLVVQCMETTKYPVNLLTIYDQWKFTRVEKILEKD